VIILAAIAACTPDRVVGYQGKIPWHSPLDLKYFKKVTEDSILVMGRKTLESLPGLLPKRIHLVVTSNPDEIQNSPWYQKQLAKIGEVELQNKVRFITSLDQVLPVSEKLLKEFPLLQKTVYVGGGEQIYQQMLPRCSFVFLTRVTLKEKPMGDAYFPELKPTQWRLLDEKHLLDGDIHLEFQLYAAAQGNQSELSIVMRFEQIVNSLT
jgi:dihydrofolate reductase